MAKPKSKKARPKPPENAKTVIAIKKLIAERTEKVVKAKAAATKEGKLNRLDAKFRLARKRLKRAQRKLYVEAVRLEPKKPVTAAAAAAAAPAAAPAATEAPAAPAAQAAPAEAEKK